MKEALIYLQSLAVMALVLMGLTGISYNLFREGGWIENVLGNVWGYTMQYPLIVIFVIVAAILLGSWWRHDHKTRGHKRLAPTIVLYLIMAAGAFFIGRLILYGKL